MTHGNGAGACVDQIGQRFQFERERLAIPLDEAHLHPTRLGRLQPGRDIGIMIHASEQDIVAGLPVGGNQRRHLEEQAGGIEAEDHFIFGAIEAGRGGGERGFDDGAGRYRRAEGAANIGAGGNHGVAHRLHDPARDLGASRRIEIEAREPIVGKG